MATNLCTVATNISGSCVWNLLPITFWRPLFRGNYSNFGKLCAPMQWHIKENIYKENFCHIDKQKTPDFHLGEKKNSKSVLRSFRY